MKKTLYPASFSVILMTTIFCCSAPAFETGEIIPSIEIIIPGISRTIEINQNYTYPQDFNQLLVFCIGYGPFNITLTKNDVVGDRIFLTGIGLSSAGIVPIFKFGETKITLTEGIEIGSQSSPYGIVWITSWVDSTVHEPPYNYILTFRF